MSGTPPVGREQELKLEQQEKIQLKSVGSEEDQKKQQRCLKKLKLSRDFLLALGNNGSVRAKCSPTRENNFREQLNQKIASLESNMATFQRDVLSARSASKMSNNFSTNYFKLKKYN